MVHRFGNVPTALAVTEHGELTGLADDDHLQYHNDARGDARYSLLVHTHPEYALATALDDYYTIASADVTFAPIDHDHDADYAALAHNHDADYADIAHDHDADYAPVGSGAPGGADTQVQYNDGGALGGNAGFTYNETNLTVNLGGGTVTANDPVLDLAQTWNGAAISFQGVKLTITNTASPDTTTYVNGNRMLSLNHSTLGEILGIGFYRSGGTDLQRFIIYHPRWSYFIADQGSGFVAFGAVNLSNPHSAIAAGTFKVLSTGGFAWSSTADAANGTPDVVLARDAAGALAQRNTTNAQTFRVYNTYTNSTNYERVTLTWSSNVCYLKPENLGTGSARLFVPVTGSTVVASLPAAATAGEGARSFVTDATATTFLSTVVGGGANKVPVVSDGTNWLIG